MTEQGPRPIDLTNQANPHRLNVRGDIFMAEGGEGSPDLGDAKFRQGLRESRLGRMAGFRKRSQETAETPPAMSGGGGGERPPAPPSGTPEPDNGGDDSSSTQGLLNRISRPEFTAVLTSDLPLEDAFILIKTQYTELYQDLLRRVGEVTSDTAGDQERQKLTKDLKQLKTDYDNARRYFAAASLSAPEHRLSDEANIELKEIESLPPGDGARSEKIMTFLTRLMEEAAPEDEALPDRVLGLIARDEAATEKFLSRLIVSEFENEPWQIKGFYGNINLEKFIRVSRTSITGPRRERMLSLIDANSSFHNMNYILRRNFEQFGQQSEAIKPEYLTLLANIPGVAEGLMLYEEYYAAARARETLITDKMASEVDRQVEDALRIQASTKDAVGNSSMRGITGKAMEDWEILRAYVYARDFYRITIRAGEQAALSELATGSALFTTPAHGKVAQILDTLKFVGFRFEPEKQMGGVELLDRTLDNNRQARRKKGVRIKTLQGTDVDNREFQGIVAARGVFATWRNAEIAFPGLRFIDVNAGGKVSNVQTFFADHSQEIAGIRDREDRAKKGKLSSTEETQLRNDTLRLFQPLIDGATINLGLLVSPSFLQLPDGLKEILWKRVADLDPLVMASMLTRLEMDKEMLKRMDKKTQRKIGEIPDVKALEDMLLETWGTDAEKRALWGTGSATDRGDVSRIQPADLNIRELRREIGRITEETSEAEIKSNVSLQIRLDAMKMELDKKEEVLKQVLQGEKWQALALKLRTAHGQRMAYEEARLRERQEGETEEQFRARLTAPKTLEDFLIGKQELDAEENTVLSAIRTNSKEITRDLVKIKQSYAWFMDDVPFKALDWTTLGQFYDRETNDLGNFNKSAGALLKIISNPFGRPPEAVLKDLAEAIASSSLVLGRAPAQDNQQPILEAYLEMISEDPKYRQIIVESISHAMRRPTSRAQEITGMDAPAVNEDAIYTILQHALKDGIVRKEVKDKKGNVQWHGTLADLEKKFGASRLNVFWGKIRDFGPLGIIVFLIQFFNSIGKDK